MNIKNNIATLVLFAFACSSYAQVEEGLLFSITNATTLEISNIDTSKITEGTLVYDTTKDKIMGYIDLQWKEIVDHEYIPKVVEKTAGYTLVAADNGTIFLFNTAADVNLSIPTGLPVGFNISVYQIGNGKVNFTGTGGVSVKNRLLRFKTAGKDAGAGLVCTKTNIFHLTGDLKK